MSTFKRRAQKYKQFVDSPVWLFGSSKLRKITSAYEQNRKRDRNEILKSNQEIQSWKAQAPKEEYLEGTERLLIYTSRSKISYWSNSCKEKLLKIEIGESMHVTHIQSECIEIKYVKPRNVEGDNERKNDYEL